VSSRFDEPVDRAGTGSLKWDAHHDPPDVLPMWVADMDFRIPPEVEEAIARRNRHGVYGYSVVPDRYVSTFVEWVDRRFDVAYDPKWVVPVTGVLAAFTHALNETSARGDQIVIQPPIYPPFFSAVERNGRSPRRNELLRSETGRYEIDFEDLERAYDEGAKVLLFCSPHNPVARVWQREELGRLLDLSARYGVTIISDEIHQDIVMPGHRQCPLLGVWQESGGTAESCPVVSVTAATKSFNLAGLSCAYLVSPNPGVRAAITDAIGRSYAGMLNTLSVEATIAAYENGEYWLDELIDYLAETIGVVRGMIESSASKIRASEVEGTYLMWLDMRDYGEPRDVEEMLLTRAKVRLNDGRTFGAPGFRRVNLATTRSRATEGVSRILAAIGEADRREAGE